MFVLVGDPGDSMPIKRNAMKGVTCALWYINSSFPLYFSASMLSILESGMSGVLGIASPRVA